MSDDLQTTDALRSWLADADHPRSTEPVADAVLGSIGSIRQEPASSLRNAPRRYAWVGLAAAAADAVRRRSLHRCISVRGQRVRKSNRQLVACSGSVVIVDQVLAAR